MKPSSRLLPCLRPAGLAWGLAPQAQMMRAGFLLNLACIANLTVAILLWLY